MITKETAIYPVFANCIIIAKPSTSEDSEVFLKRTGNCKTFENGKDQADFYLGDFVGEYIYSGENWLEVRLADGRSAYGAVDMFLS
jgi:hypothetical protein